MDENRTGGIIPFPQPAPAKAPYFAWLDRHYPGGEIGHNPPVSDYLASPDLFNAWTSHVPDGADPDLLRFDVYLRRQWRLDAGALCVANLGPAGDAAPQEWNEEALGLMRAALAEVEAAARAAGFARIAFENADAPIRPALAALGYEVAEGVDLLKQVA